MITFHCANKDCGILLKASSRAAGKTLACPKCKTQVKVPAQSPKAPGTPDKSAAELDSIPFAELPDIGQGEKRERFAGVAASILAQILLLLLMLLMPGGFGRGVSGDAMGEVGFGQLDGEQLTNNDDGNLDDFGASAGGEVNPGLTASPDIGVAQSNDGAEGLELSIGGAGGGGGVGGEGFGFGGRNGGAGEASFMGTSARGQRFCIIADNSGSMNGPPLEFVKDEILKTIGNARGSARFTVIFFNSVAELPPNPKWISGKAELANIAKWVNTIQARNGTSPVRGMEAAMLFDPPPDVIYIMTDGLFNPVEVQQINALNKRLKRPAQIHTIAFMQRAGENLLKQIAQDAKGTYRFVPGYGP